MNGGISFEVQYSERLAPFPDPLAPNGGWGWHVLQRVVKRALVEGSRVSSVLRDYTE